MWDMAERAIVMTSGGMDSTVLLYWALARGFNVTPVFIDYGQHCSQAEVDSLQTNLPPDVQTSLEVVRVADVFKHSPSRMIRETDLWKESIAADDLMLPYRNLFLLVAGAAFAASRGVDTLMAAFINSNHAYEIDATAAFLAGADLLIGRLGNVKLLMPFKEWSKTQVAIMGADLGVPIAQTFSCQVNAVEHCGSCPNCVERLAALAAVANGIAE
jgi:7-cyano-7-deazaguanine synthase